MRTKCSAHPAERERGSDDDLAGRERDEPGEERDARKDRKEP